MNDPTLEKSLATIDTRADPSWHHNALLTVLALLAIFSVFYIVELTAFSLSIDDELAALRTDARIWVQTGRWTTYLFETYIMPQPTMPFLPVILFGFFLACGYLLLLKSLRLPEIRQAHFAGFAIFSGFPIWYFLVEFQGNIAAEGLAVLAGCAMTMPLGRAIDSKRLTGLWSVRTLVWIGAAGSLGAVSIGAYQSNAMLLAVLGIVLVIWTAKTDAVAGVAGILGNLVLVLLTLFAALAAYFVVVRLFQISLQAPPVYLDKILNPALLYSYPRLILSRALNEVVSVYTGSSQIYGTTAFSFGFIIIAGLAGLLDLFWKNWRILSIFMLLAVLMLLIPFSLNPVSAFSGQMPYRTFVSVPIIMWFFAFLGFSASRLWLVRFTGITVAFAVFHMLYIGNIFQASNALLRQHDLVTAAALYEAIAKANEDFDRTRSYNVYFAGAFFFSSIYPKISTSTFGASFFEWDNGNPARMLAYMRLLGYDNLQAAAPGQAKLWWRVVANMPIWPAQGSVRVEGDVTLVKLRTPPKPAGRHRASLTQVGRGPVVPLVSMSQVPAGAVMTNERPAIPARRHGLRVPMNDTARLFRALRGELTDAVLAAADSGTWLKGARSEAFTNDFAGYIGARHCLLVANGTDALELAMRALLPSDAPARREVITVANAGGYAVAAGRQVGLVPVFADIVEETQLVDPGTIVAALSEATAMVVVTHLYGGIFDVPALRRKIDAAGYPHVPIIEDCAQAHGGSLGGRRAGCAGTVGTFSFYPTKNLGAMGDAGAIVTSDAGLHATLLQLHQYGWSARYRIAIPGGRNSRIDELQAAVLSVLLPRLDAMNERRRTILAAYREAAPSGLRFLDYSGDTVAHLAVALCSEREQFRRHMQAHGVATDVHYPVLDFDQSGWAGLPQRIGPGGVDVSRSSVGRIVSVPCFPFLTDDEVSVVVAALSAWRMA